MPPAVLLMRMILRRPEGSRRAKDLTDWVEVELTKVPSRRKAPAHLTATPAADSEPSSCSESIFKLKFGICDNEVIISRNTITVSLLKL